MVNYKELCKGFESCNAPLCPLQPDIGLWYADEDICKAKEFQTLDWLKKQKRVAKLGLSVDAGFLTVRMLNAIKAITKTLTGANPDDFDSEEKWLKQR